MLVVNMSSENGKDGKEKGIYMARRKFYVPKKEQVRFYGCDGDLSPNDVILPCDYEEVEEE